MTLAEKFCLTAAFLFFMTGLFAGIWKYLQMTGSPKTRSRHYVDAAHSTSFLYALAALLLGMFARHSVFPAMVNTISALTALVFFGSTIALNILTGIKSDTISQIRESKNSTPGFSPMWMVNTYMVLLTIGEVGGAAVLGTGALTAIWS